MKHTISVISLVGSMFLCATGFAGETKDAEVMFDTDTQTYLADADGDSFPDLTEKLAGTDSLSAEDYPGNELTPEQRSSVDETRNAGFPVIFCRWGFRTVGRLCIDFNVQNAARYDVASQRCRDRWAHVATYEDLAYLYLTSTVDATYNPNGRWLGNMTGNNRALRGNANITFNNDPDIFNFEVEDDKAESKPYWCAHDRS